MTATPAAAPMLVVTHVGWEGPHRIADACRAAGLTLIHRRPLAGDALPAVGEVAGAVFMGGPMNVDDTATYPQLADERTWLEGALADDLPVLGVCLGAQLIARALGAVVAPGPRPEIGWAPVRVHDADDPLLGALAPTTDVLHWHGDRFDVPPGATALASSDLTPCQAFRRGDAWGVLFHAEADAVLVERWLGEPTMREEAIAALGPDAAALLRAGAADHGDGLTERSAAGFTHFAALAARRGSEPVSRGH